MAPLSGTACSDGLTSVCCTYLDFKLCMMEEDFFGSRSRQPSFFVNMQLESFY
jgi:hypothetical protein